jgi:predicted nuclease of predicted toxin-antitoxin system
VIAIKVDEDLPEDLVDLLRGRGLDAISVRTQGWSGRPDDQVLADIQGEGRWLLTADKGFSDVRRYAPGSHHGIVLFRAERESRSAYLALAEALLAAVDLATVPGALVVVSHRGTRIVRAR